MSAGLNIKRKETVERIRRVAQAKGVSMTDAVDAAIRREEEALDDEIARRRAKAEAYLAELDARMPKRKFRTDKELDAELYDEHGLPR
jgi:hypothetical protein